jgi:hypothetical protein
MSTVFLDVRPHSLVYCDQCFVRTCYLHLHGFTLEREAASSSKSLVSFYQTTWHHTAEDNIFSHHCQNLKSNKHHSVPQPIYFK